MAGFFFFNRNRLFTTDKIGMYGNRSDTYTSIEMAFRFHILSQFINIGTEYRDKVHGQIEEISVGRAQCFTGSVSKVYISREQLSVVDID